MGLNIFAVVVIILVIGAIVLIIMRTLKTAEHISKDIGSEGVSKIALASFGL